MGDIITCTVVIASISGSRTTVNIQYRYIVNGVFPLGSQKYLESTIAGFFLT